MKKNKEKSAASAAQQQYLKNLTIKKIIINVCRLAILVLFFGLWELFAKIGVIDTFDLSCPSRMFSTFLILLKGGELWLHIGTTLLECFLGFTIATAVGVGIAIALWWSEYLRRVLEPYVIVLNSLPKVALGPLIILWVGAGMEAIVTMAVLIAVIITVISSLSSLMSCEKDQVLLLKSMGANKLQVLIKLAIPRAIPDFMSIIKVNVGLAWVGTIMGEYLVSRAGLGHLIVYGSQVFNSDLVMTATVILCLLAAFMYFVVAFVEKLVIRSR